MYFGSTMYYVADIFSVLVVGRRTVRPVLWGFGRLIRGVNGPGDDSVRAGAP